MILTNNDSIELLPRMANRHGFIAGATGTGKTVTLKLMAEKFSEIGVPVFLADIKGDLAGLGMSKYPVTFWDAYNETGVPFHNDVYNFSSMLLAKLLALSESQASILAIIMHEYQGEVHTLEDLRKVLTQALQKEGGHPKVSVNALIRKIRTLEIEGGDIFFEGTAIDINDLFTVKEGLGVINILDATKLIHKPELYATSIMSILQGIYEKLPEVGDIDKPKLVFFFDEAHLLFTDCPKILLKTIERIIRLIRSKGVGVYFITQSPKDIPDPILAQLGNRIQHALRAYTPKEFHAVKIAAQTFRANSFNTEEVITQLGIGEALVSFLDAKGAPSVVERVKILQPESMKYGVIDKQIREDINNNEILNEKYLTSIITKEQNVTVEGKYDVWKIVTMFANIWLFLMFGLLKLGEAIIYDGGRKGRR